MSDGFFEDEQWVGMDHVNGHDMSFWEVSNCGRVRRCGGHNTTRIGVFSIPTKDGHTWRYTLMVAGNQPGVYVKSSFSLARLLRIFFQINLNTSALNRVACRAVAQSMIDNTAFFAVKSAKKKEREKKEKERQQIIGFQRKELNTPLPHSYDCFVDTPGCRGVLDSSYCPFM